MILREMREDDLEEGFLDVLESQMKKGQAQALYGMRRNMGIRTYVATIDGMVVATASLLVEPKFAGYYVGYLKDVKVHPLYYRGKEPAQADNFITLGSNVVNYTLVEAKKLNCRFVLVHSSLSLIPFFDCLGMRWETCGMRIDLEKNVESS